MWMLRYQFYRNARNHQFEKWKSLAPTGISGIGGCGGRKGRGLELIRRRYAFPSRRFEIPLIRLGFVLLLESLPENFLEKEAVIASCILPPKRKPDVRGAVLSEFIPGSKRKSLGKDERIRSLRILNISDIEEAALCERDNAVRDRRVSKRERALVTMVIKRTNELFSDRDRRIRRSLHRSWTQLFTQSLEYQLLHSLQEQRNKTVIDYPNDRYDVHVRFVDVLVFCDVAIWISCDETRIFWNSVSVNDDEIAYARSGDENHSAKMSGSDVYSLMTKIHSSMTSWKKSNPMMKIDAFF
ncbi:hypothetical protein DPMN_103125 [Dreissena polymorpha]|uniref:Uncharacterized protein n=1 Tax=Dreissena polymorpha TaxID=45954 RepID=A0A9D4K0I0_DREPO|nr:hypothetical protein DPMN_103125 [Dreissena polymorpha]